MRVEPVVFVFASMVLLWLWSLKLRNSAIVDVFWGLGFVGIAWLGVAFGAASPSQRLLVAGLVTLWGGRLSLHLFVRNRGKPEDARYAAMRSKAGASWPVRSLFVVFGLQGVLMLLISLPLQVAASAPVGMEHAAGAALVLIGVAFEAIADAQLARHKREKPGTLMTTGLWSWSRHPNYFGDFVVWWGLFVFSARAAPWTVVSPVVMSVLLMRVSGVTLLEKSMRKKAGWEEYAAKTSAFFPRPPK